MNRRGALQVNLFFTLGDAYRDQGDPLAVKGELIAIEDLELIALTQLIGARGCLVSQAC